MVRNIAQELKQSSRNVKKKIWNHWNGLVSRWGDTGSGQITMFARMMYVFEETVANKCRPHPTKLSITSKKARGLSEAPVMLAAIKAGKTKQNKHAWLVGPGGGLGGEF